MPTSEATGAETPPARGLIAHAGYACRHSGVCCSSDWAIPVEDALQARLTQAIAAGALRPRDEIGLTDWPGLPPGTRSVLGRRHGRCVFHGEGPSACDLHAWGGPEAKPVACRQFPWIAVHDPRGTFVSLSHVCPSAGARLADAALLQLVPMPRSAATFDGLDVRRALPPAVSARRLLDWDALSAWETQALDACARNDGPDGVLRDLLALRLHARRWTPGQGSLAAWVAAWTPDPSPPSSVPDAAGADAAALDAIVRAAVPAGLAVPAAVGRIDAPRWDAAGPLVRRYLAARLVACWPLHYGTGVATAIAYVAALLAVVATELSRQAAPSTSDNADVVTAIAEADRLVVHLAAPDALARGLDAWAASRLDGGL